MEKILKISTYDIPSVVNRYVDLKLKEEEYDPSKKVFVKIIQPSNFEDVVLTAIINNKKNGPTVAVHKRIDGKVLHPIRRVTLKSFQIVEDIPVKAPVQEVKPLNPETPPKEKEKSIIGSIFTGKVALKDFKTISIENAQKRKQRLARVCQEVKTSPALKPSGNDGKTILCGDDVDYSRTIAILTNLKSILKKHNNHEGNGPNHQKMLYQYYDIFSFSGIGSVISFYMALGKKVKGDGDLNFLESWVRNELSKIYSPTSIGELAKKGKNFVNNLKPKKLRPKPNPGLSIKQAEKIIGWLFENKYTGEPYRLKDIENEVYQPVFFDDEQSRVYSKAETPNAKIVDVILNTGLDPLYFQSRKIENFGLSMGPARRSFELPFAQHNNSIILVSIGTELTYQETECNFEGMNPAQAAFLNKKKNYRIDYLDAEKYMKDHPCKVNYLRIESGQLYGVMANSISKKDLDACVKSAENRTKFWSNKERPVIEALEWS